MSMGGMGWDKEVGVGIIASMSGHSKWATIHRQKEVKDSKRGAAFTKLAANITMAVKQGGGIGDPEKNFKLRLAIEKARQFNMPKENITRAIDKGTGKGGVDEMQEAVFEGFLPGGAAVIVEAVTDNHVRTAQHVRLVLDKSGGTMGSTGTVNYMFKHEGEVVVGLEGKSAEDAELAAIDLGAQDLELEEGKLVVYCEKEKTFEFKEKLEQAGFTVESAQLIMKPSVLHPIDNEETRERVERVLEQLEELDDVTSVWTNYA